MASNIDNLNNDYGYNANILDVIDMPRKTNDRLSRDSKSSEENRIPLNNNMVFILEQEIKNKAITISEEVTYGDRTVSMFSYEGKGYSRIKENDQVYYFAEEPSLFDFKNLAKQKSVSNENLKNLNANIALGSFLSIKA